MVQRCQKDLENQGHCAQFLHTCGLAAMEWTEQTKVWEVGCFENLVVAGRIFFFAGKHYGTYAYRVKIPAAAVFRKTSGKFEGLDGKEDRGRTLFRPDRP